MKKAFLSNFTCVTIKPRSFLLASTPPQVADGMVVQYRAQFLNLLTYVYAAKDHEDVVNTFFTGLKTTLVRGIWLLLSTFQTRPEFLGAIA